MALETHLNPDRRFLLEHIKFDKHIVVAEGNYLFDEEGNQYLDFLAQYGAVPFGYNPEFLWQRLEQVHANKEPSLVQPLLSPAAENLAKKLVSLAPGEMHYVTFTNSGAESVEAAIKLARSKTKRQTVLSTTTGFHGKTLGAVSATGNAVYKAPFYPDTSCFEHIAFNDLDALQTRLEQGDIAAFIVEPVQGEGGMVEAAPGYLSKASKLCKKHGALFIVDEIQTGIGRTGTMFATQSEQDIHIDILLVAKALGGGLVSLGAVLCRKNVWTPEFGYFHSSTFANNHLSCAIGLATIERLLENGSAMLRHVQQMGAYLEKQLKHLIQKYPTAFSGTSGKGLMRGIKLTPWDGEQSYLMALAGDTGNAVPLVCGYLLNQHKILTAPVFNHTGVVRIEPPLTITKKEIDLLIAALQQTAEALSKANYYELFMHVVGEPEQSSKKFIRHLDFSKTSSRANPLCKKENLRGKFAFLIHPTEFKDLLSCQPPAFELFNEDQQEKWQQWLKSWCSRRYEPGVVYHMPVFRSKKGGHVEGWLIGCPLTPDQMMRLSLRERKKLIQEFVAIAKRLKVDILGLGAFTSVITRAGSDIADCGVNITTGNSLTAMASAESILLAARKNGIDAMRACAGVVGAAGSVGRLVCKRLATEIGSIVLFGNPSNSKSSLKLESFAGELYWGLLSAITKNQDPAIAQRLLSVKPQTFWEEFQRQTGKKENIDFGEIYRFVNQQFVSCNQEPPLLATVELNRYLGTTQLVVSATSQGAAFIEPAQLANDAIVCDAARPPDVRKDINQRRKDILVYEGGLLNLPEKIRFGKDNVIGFPDGINLACLSETIALAFTKPTRNYSVGTDVPLEEAQYIYQTALSHGFEIALLDSEGEVASDSDPLGHVSVV